MGLFFRKEPAGDDRMDALMQEFTNYRRRTAQELEAAHEKAARETILPFLSLYDDLARALDAPCSDESYRKGIELIFKNLLAALASLNVCPMDSKGKIFNPAYHDAVRQIDDPALRKEEIAEVLQVGFLMDDEVIRHATVVVANCDEKE